MSRSERVYRSLLRAYPRHTRDAYGDDMAQLFADQLRDTGSGVGKAAVWARAITDALIDGPRERATGRRVAKVVGGPAVEVPRPLGPDLFAGAAPILFAGLLLLVAPGFLDPLFDDRASLAGLPFGVTVTIILALLAGLGIFALRRGGLRDSRTRLLAAAVLAIPVPAMLFLHGIGSIVPYLLVSALFLAVTSVRWLSFAVAVPFVLWLLFGPAIVLVLINLGGSAT